MRGRPRFQPPPEAPVVDAAETGKVLLASRGLKEFPHRAVFGVGVEKEQWWLVEEVRLIDLSHNEIPTIPDELDRLSESLHVFRISGNKLQNLPDSIATCTHLKNLDVSHNSLTMFPTISPLNQLVELNVSGNKLRTFDLSGLGKLEILRASGNALQNLSLQGVEFLLELDISDNALTTLPVGLERNSRLKTLRMNGNMLTHADLTSLSNLVHLELRRNQISTPPIISPGSALSEYYLGSNRLQSTVAMQYQLPFLTVFDISDNAVHEVPSFLQQCPQLITLDVRNNEINLLPVWMGFMPNLTRVVLDGNPLRSVRRGLISTLASAGVTGKGTSAAVAELKIFLKSRATEEEGIYYEHFYAKEKTMNNAKFRKQNADAMDIASEKVQFGDKFVDSRPAQPVSTMIASSFFTNHPNAMDAHIEDTYLPSDPSALAPSSSRSTLHSSGAVPAGPSDPFSPAANEDYRKKLAVHAKVKEQSTFFWTNWLREAFETGKLRGDWAQLPNPMTYFDIASILQEQATNLPPSVADKIRVVDLSLAPLGSLDTSGDQAYINAVQVMKDSEAGRRGRISGSMNESRAMRIVKNAIESSQNCLAPDILFFCNQLEELNLSRTRLVTLPLALTATTLREFQLDASCIALRSLNLSNNPIISTVWDAVKDLPSSLEILNLSQCKLSNFPTNLFQLPRLCELNLDYNQICTDEECASSGAPITPSMQNSVSRSLDDDATYLPSLHTLTLSNNRMRRVPSGILALPTLMHLDISYNDIDTVPSHLGAIPALQSLKLEGNPQRTIRPMVMDKGSVAVITFLRNRIAAGTERVYKQAYADLPPGGKYNPTYSTSCSSQTNRGPIERSGAYSASSGYEAHDTWNTTMVESDKDRHGYFSSQSNIVQAPTHGHRDLPTNTYASQQPATLQPSSSHYHPQYQHHSPAQYNPHSSHAHVPYSSATPPCEAEAYRKTHQDLAFSAQPTQHSHAYGRSGANTQVRSNDQKYAQNQYSYGDAGYSGNQHSASWNRSATVNAVADRSHELDLISQRIMHLSTEIEDYEMGIARKSISNLSLMQMKRELAKLRAAEIKMRRGDPNP